MPYWCPTDATPKALDVGFQCLEDGVQITGIKVWPKTAKNDKFVKKGFSFKNSSPDSKEDLSEKLVLGIWRLILSRYDIIWNIYIEY